jgi:hypothetical protein
MKRVTLSEFLEFPLKTSHHSNMTADVSRLAPVDINAWLDAYACPFTPLPPRSLAEQHWLAAPHSVVVVARCPNGSILSSIIVTKREMLCDSVSVAMAMLDECGEIGAACSMRGVHSRLLNAAIEAAAELNCHLICVRATSASSRHYTTAGFQAVPLHFAHVPVCENLPSNLRVRRILDSELTVEVHLHSLFTEFTLRLMFACSGNRCHVTFALFVQFSILWTNAAHATILEHFRLAIL